jgi:hypothetical protein
VARFIEEDDPTKADASPTKRFFADIITKDIQLDQAIQDLVDNSVDGARRLRPGGDYHDLWVNIRVAADCFSIADNCGGIPLEIARKYAFKFGRAEGFAATTHSVGQFGIGMKRALFKIGDQFEVISTEPKAHFEIRVNIKEWLDDKVNWDFPIEALQEKRFAPAKTGTTLKIGLLAQGVGDRFKQNTFVSELRQDIRAKQQQAMQRGLQITLNDEVIITNEWKLKQSDHILPSFKRFDDTLKVDSLLITRIYAGVNESDRQRAGWYVFCNGRCILEADQERTTGWNEVSEGGVAVPKYHGQFARFRGYVFLDADDASILPWNTTKTGLDQESAAYRRLKPRLIEATRPVIDFLNKLDAEKDMEESDRVLTRAVEAAAPVPLERLPERAAFQFTAPAKKGPQMSTISYKKPKADADRLKAAMSVGTLPRLGEVTFDYAYNNLVEED